MPTRAASIVIDKQRAACRATSSMNLSYLTTRLLHYYIYIITTELASLYTERLLPFTDITLTNVKVNTNDNHVTRSTIEVQVSKGPRFIVKHHRWRTWYILVALTFLT